MAFHTPAAFCRYRAPMLFRAGFLALSLVVCAPLAAAQQQAPAQNVTGEAAYRAQLAELAQVLGGAHYLRFHCQGRRDQQWRDYVVGLVRREPRFQALLTENFNRGFREQEQRYWRCDEDARQMEQELRARGLRIANGLSASGRRH